MRTAPRPVAALLAALVVAALAGCAGGPSEAEVLAWNGFALIRQSENAADTSLKPESVREYVLGAAGAAAARYDGADAVLAGHFTGAQRVPDGTSGTERIVATFAVDASLYGPYSGSVDIDVGLAPEGVDVASAMRGAGNLVVFLVVTPSGLRLADGAYAIAVSARDGRLTMPLVDPGEQAAYLDGVRDVADVKALLIAGGLDHGGVLDPGSDIGNDGVSDTEQDLIDRANDLAG